MLRAISSDDHYGVAEHVPERVLVLLVEVDEIDCIADDARAFRGAERRLLPHLVQRQERCSAFALVFQVIDAA
jgi:hypothetical protein